MTFWTYMLHCADRTLYVGHTDDLERRIGQHELGLIPGYTSTRRPVKLVWSEAFPTRTEAREAEERLKGWGRSKKLALIRGDWPQISELAKGKKEGASTSSAKPASVFLRPHLDHLPTEPLSLEATVQRRADRLYLRYRLTGDVGVLKIPRLLPQARADDLWRHTCFEAFLKLRDDGAYAELNFSPSGRWAAYRFDDYRQGMREWEIGAPKVRIVHERYRLEVAGSINLPPKIHVFALNLTAVIEEKSGHKSYWALAHPPEGPPDFHHLACFVLELPTNQQEPSPRT